VNKQHTAIISYLKKHRELTIFESFAKLHITKPQSRFTELRRLGYHIQGRWIRKGDTRVKAYWLDQKRSRALKAA
jgi:hypothetical protein